MKYTNNTKHKQHNGGKSLWQRVLSFVIVLALVTNTMYSGGLFGLLDFHTVLKAEAAGESYTTTYDKTTFSDNSFTFGNDSVGKKQFCDYCYYYNTDSDFAADHYMDQLSINFTELAESDGFMGLGNAAKPFAGSLKFLVDANNKSNIMLPRAIFTHVNTDAKITDNNGNTITLQITKNSSASSPILADRVYHGTNAADWKIEVAAGNTNSFAGVLGQMEENANVTLEFNNASSAAVSNTSSGENDIKDVGELCGVMKTGSFLTVTDTSTTRPSVTSASGNAGSLIGTMEGTAALTLNNDCPAFNSSVTATNGYAGGLVGESSTSAAITITDLSSPLAVGGTVTGKSGAGGLYGHYTNSAAEFDLKDYNITATVSGEICGGVFGVLKNKKGESETALSLTIKNTGNAGIVDVKSGSSAGNYFGGLIGKYETDDLKNSLILDSLTFSATSNASFTSFGGAIGLVDCAAYIKADKLIVTAKGTDKKDTSSYFGGLIGKTADSSGVFVDLGDFILTASDTSGFKGGGIVGSFKNGVLRLSGTTDMSGAKSQKGGQLVGENDNVLIYALGTGTNGTAYESGWTFKRSNGSKADDLGTWGEVVRSITDSASTGIIYFNSTDHTATLSGVTADSTDDDYKIASKDDFVKTALNIQLNQGADYDCLKFTVGSADRAGLLAGTITITSDISLAGTGINGFMRDGSSSVGTFTGTLIGGSKTITLAIGEKYGQDSNGDNITADSDAEGLGQIYAHPYNGLFSFIGNGSSGTGTVNSLTIAGTINVRNTINGMNVGGIAAVSQGSTTLNGITANQTINYGEPSAITGAEKTGKNIGGLIGIANGTDNGTIAITGTSAINTTFNISDYFNSWNCLGAAIGKVTSTKFIIDIAQGESDKLTVSHTMKGDYTAGSNADGGGLIGYITAGTYSDRKVNINHLDFNNCTIINKASTNGGGFLGYAWLDTDTTIDGLTVTDGAITNSSPNVGVMCYVATGRWTVNSLAVTKMSISDGAGNSLGMLVNKAYNDKNGLYLDVLNAGYKLKDKTGDTGITLPAALKVYDELAAYSAADVIKGGAGVISVNMNTGRHDPKADPADNYTEAKVTVTGTYQNQLTSASSAALVDTAYANPNSRYYYNLDVLDNTNAGQNLLLWSVNKYAASNIKGLFSSTISNNTLTGTADMTGLSFYPIAGTDSYILSGLTLTMNYDGVYGAESVFGTSNPTDSYIRDPGASGTNQNQHYLMQSGLFTSLSNQNTLTLSGNNKLSGTFLEIDGVSGVLISGTSNGSVVSSSDSTLVLDGIISKTTGNEAYKNGYLLVNSITRADSIDSADDITIKLEGISTTNTYSSGTTVAKSLLGAASGSNLNIEFTKIKLDSRTTVLSDNTALNTAYGTTRSIFTDSTLLASIKTDDKAQLKYFYTIVEDWGTDGSNGNRWVTYGKEVTDSKEYRENNVSQENKYDGSAYYTNPVTYQSSSAYNFSEGFLPYVAEEFTEAKTNELYFRELKVNVSASGLIDGCGSYNDPYIITDGKQLTAVSRFISTGSTDELSKVNLPKEKGNYDTIAKNDVV